MKTINELSPYIEYPFYYQRRQTRIVKIKNIYVGANFPIILQSMLTCPSSDVFECLSQIKALQKVGCQMVRLSIMHKKDLDTAPQLLALLKNEGIDLPLVADVHFAANLAVAACEFFDKVRINPGNFSDRPKNHQISKHISQDFSEGKLRLAERIKKLAINLKKYNRALRIGVNHGSLSLRMIEKFGDTPLAMVYSALEAAQMFSKEGITNMVVSLKSSNPLVTNIACRLFAALNKGSDAIPLHLGVTEAGNQEIGRAKSLCGIGPLLADGIGDSIRISLTEDSVNEIIFARKVKNFISQKYAFLPDSDRKNLPPADVKNKNQVYIRKAEEYRIQNKSLQLGQIFIGGSSNIKLGLSDDHYLQYKDEFLADFAYQFIGDDKLTLQHANESLPVKILSAAQLSTYAFNVSDKTSVCVVNPDVKDLRLILRSKPANTYPVGLLLSSKEKADLFDGYYLEVNTAAIISEGLVDFILLPVDATIIELKRLMDILHATRVKLFETDYVACPSCGRTLFDLQIVTNKVKIKTKHLKGIKIGVLGCMVNGPGEMADADFGYVGASRGKIDLYVGQNRIKKNIPAELAVDELIQIIKEQGRWVDP